MELPPLLVRLPDGNMRRVHAVNLPEEFDQEIQSWDLAFKDLEASDYVAGVVWGVKGADRYFLDQVRDRLGFPSRRNQENVAEVAKAAGSWSRTRPTGPPQPRSEGD